ncbi:MAG: cytochrome c oxidase, cbb3-type, CcoQ subunit [Sulfurimonas sp.]|uniref:cytochrome c oxidase, cbb3-type, CcoQ subunit n=1 Tax=Sulfurimonas sp. TaxID=2022749 RepID=UPI0025DFE2C7|nr:cytochrome c oxidase, cbb3-type, CcoQ subunit [Sulfurimonas sp.]MCK9492153.1 cytochrome c oxidase, cbb3-type, CcoQ subunit [Sulfurimonas sp.]
MDIAQLQAYGYFALTVFLVIGLYGYIYHLYSKRKNSDGVDYEEYSNMALHDDIDDTPVASISDDKKK